MDVRAACLLVAAASRPTLELLVRVASAEAVEAAVAADVLVVDDRGQVSFRHPLLAAAAYRQGSLRDRRCAHEQLARETTDPEERGRHLALVSDGPDPAVARTLDAAADAARRRGATYAAAELAQLARDRTLAVSDRARRSLTLADDLFQLGDTSGAREAAEQALLGTTATCGRSRLLLARIEWLTGSGVRALELAESALAIADAPLMEAEILTEIAFLSRADRIKGAASARRAVELLERAGDDAARPLLARALTARVFVESDLGLPLSPELVARARALTPHRERERVSDRIGYYLGTVLFDYDDLDGARPLLEESLAAARDEGDEGSLTSVLDQLSQLEVLAGAWTKARGLAAEQARLAELTGQEAQRLWGVETLAAIDAREGDLDAAAARLGEVLAGARKLPDPMTIAFAQRTASFVALTQGDAAAACAASAEATEIADAIGVFSSGALRHEPDHAEALVELGRFDDAARVIDRLQQRGRRAELLWAAATGARCRALLAAATGDLDAASTAIADALRDQQRLAMPFELARTHLVAGRIHRRRKEKRAARESFERAEAMFAELGSRAWAERARKEARRLGGRTPTPNELTPTERLVADLAAAGLTNPEIAARLFMSRKTVEFNLGKVYRKLGVRGRTELAVHASNSGDLPGSERPLAP